jgi:hypothetical protein
MIQDTPPIICEASNCRNMEQSEIDFYAGLLNDMTFTDPTCAWLAYDLVNSMHAGQVVIGRTDVWLSGPYVGDSYGGGYQSSIKMVHERYLGSPGEFLAFAFHEEGHENGLGHNPNIMPNTWTVEGCPSWL